MKMQYEEKQILNRLRNRFIDYFYELGQEEIVLPDRFKDKNVNVDNHFDYPITMIRYNVDTRHVEVYVEDWGYGWYDAEVADCGNVNFNDRNGTTILERAGISILSRAMCIRVEARKVYLANIHD